MGREIEALEVPTRRAAVDDSMIDPTAFVFTYPVFFLLDPKPPVSFVSRDLIGHPGYGILVFTDEAAADEYLANNPQPPGVIKHPAQNEPTFAGKLAILAEQDKFTHLILDDRGGSGPTPKRCIAIKRLVEHFARKR
jgi:hypothetical protein